MGNRHADWLRQAEADLRHARNARASSDHEWACFAAGAPTDYYTDEEAERAIADAGHVIELCRDTMG